MNPITRPRLMAAVPFAGLVVCLVALLATNVADLDHGFHVAQGSWILHHGLPDHQILVPAQEAETWTSIYPIGSVLIAVVWMAGGAAMLVVLKMLCYGGAFVLCALACVRRGAAPWLACLMTSAAACLMTIRYVERPTMVSILLLSALIWWFAKPKRGDWLMRPAVWVAVAVISSVWALTHAGWNIGLAAFVLLTFATVREWKPRLVLTACAVVTPVAVILLVHPAGIEAIAGPLRFVGGEGAKFSVREHSMAAWGAMPLALAMLPAAAVCGVVLFRKRRPFEALLLCLLIAGTLRFPRFVLPLAIVTLPFACELLAGRVRVLPSRVVVFLALLIALAGVATIRLTPWRSWGFGMDPSLDTRGVGAALDSFKPEDGVVLAEFGWSSLLLSNESVARQGVVMDGRLEEYGKDYYESVYVPALVPGENWEEAVARTGAGFYCVSWPGRGGGVDLSRELEQRPGWRFIAWDDSSRLYARPDVVIARGVQPLRWDPARLDEYLAMGVPLPHLETEFRRGVSELDSRGLPSARGRVALARLFAAQGRFDEAEESLELAADDQGMRYSSWWGVKAACAVERGDERTARMCARKLRGMGKEDLALRVEDAIRSTP